MTFDPLANEPVPAPLLHGRKSDHSTVWVAKVFRDAREAAAQREPATPQPRLRGPRRSLVPASDRERHRFTAAYAAMGDLRRYGSSNAITALSVLTFRRHTALDAAWAAWGPFLRRLRRRFGRFPWIVVPEYQWSGSVHLNVLTQPGPDATVISGLWAYGRASQPRNGPIPGLTTIEQARALVRYVTKDWVVAADQTPPGRHRYRTARGYRPRAVEVSAPTLRELHAILCELFGSRPKRFWSSDFMPDWVGPATVAMQWR